MTSEQVWTSHPEHVWVKAAVQDYQGKMIVVQDDYGGVATVEREKTHPVDATHLKNLDDIAKMNNMHEAPLLDLLRRRYMNDEIYTFTGEILISINPYFSIPGLYDMPDETKDYHQEREPHVYAIGYYAYYNMLQQSDPRKKNQSMIVSGESGAGKTEACKHIMRYLAQLSGRYVEKRRKASIVKGESKAEDSMNVEARVLACNPFLEALGNATTLRNDNSSRFGKFLQIEYDGGRIIGARVEHYLLEKARVVAPHEGERNYHMFYLLCAGATEEEKKELGLLPPEKFSYLNRSSKTVVETIDDKEWMDEIRVSLRDVGIDEKQQREMYRVVAGILHMGNVVFRPAAAEEDPATIENGDVAALAGELLGAKGLPQKLLERIVTVKGRTSTYCVQLNAVEAEKGRDALAKATYEALFTWVISQINKELSAKTEKTAFIGILDIFGFELFQVNSFEQLCINYANEKLQNLFNHHIFEMEQEQYKAEGVSMETIKFINNRPCVELLEKKPSGVLPTLDEICTLNRKGVTEKDFLNKLDHEHKGKHKCYGKRRPHETNQFTIKHFAGSVTYHIDNFIEKNNDTLTQDLKAIMITSDSAFVRDIFSAGKKSTPIAAAAMKGRGRRGVGGAMGGGGGNRSRSTIATKFKTQLGVLHDTLMSTSPHYVRCIKPNKVKGKHVYDSPMVLTQLLYSGVLETVRIRRQVRCFVLGVSILSLFLLFFLFLSLPD